jgi:RNA polymerase sigma-70 factor (ECF subfamily)
MSCDHAAAEAAISAALDAGDEPLAFELLVRSYRALIGYVMLRIVPDPGAIDDLIQQTFQQAFRDRHALRLPERRRSWLVAIATHRAIDELRRARRRARTEVDVEGDDLDAIADPQPPPEDELDAVRRRRRLHTAIARLAPRTRVAVQMRYLDGRPYAEIALVLDEKADTVRTRVIRALPRLRQLLGRQTL